MGEILTKEFLSELYDETRNKAENYCKVLGLGEKEVRILHAQLFFDELKRVPIGEFYRLITTENDK